MPPTLARGLRPSREYLGNEFCERLLPAPRALLAGLERVRRSGRAATVVLPYVGPAAFRRAETLLDVLAMEAPGTEVVANDWGVLAKVGREHRLVPVLGRCLDRTLRDPRIPVHLAADVPSEAREALRSGSRASEAFHRLCARHRVARIEIDVPPLGLASETVNPPLPFAISVYVPFGFVTSGRVCPLAVLSRCGRMDRFAPGRCRYECTRLGLEMHASPGDAGALPLQLRGNTVFYRHDAVLERDIEAAARHLPVDRVVWQTDVPMARLAS